MALARVLIISILLQKREQKREGEREREMGGSPLKSVSLVAGPLQLVCMQWQLQLQLRDCNCNGKGRDETGFLPVRPFILSLSNSYIHSIRSVDGKWRRKSIGVARFLLVR